MAGLSARGPGGGGGVGQDMWPGGRTCGRGAGTCGPGGRDCYTGSKTHPSHRKT